MRRDGGSVAPGGTALDELAGVFGDRLKRDPRDAPALVLPRDAGEVAELSRVAGSHSLTLLAQGAGTGGGAAPETPGNVVLVRFDLMASIRLPEGDGDWVEAGPGATLLSLENNLEARGLGLAVYPTSAPRATVGGWISGEGIGVGSFEYGRLPENVLSAEVVMTGGRRRMVPGGGLLEALREDPGALLASARLRTRPARDTPFAASFDGLDGLAAAATKLAETNTPLWHLAFLNAEMARARNLGERPLLFGACPQKRTPAVAKSIAAALDGLHAQTLSTADAHRVWGQRFSPVAPSRPTPHAERRVVTLAEIPATLRCEERPVQGTVARSGEVLILTLTDQ